MGLNRGQNFVKSLPIATIIRLLIVRAMPWPVGGVKVVNSSIFENMQSTQNKTFF